MGTEEKLAAIREYVAGIFENDATGHDFFHMKRVARTAGEISVKEGADLFITEAAAWVHDIGDAKLSTDPAAEVERLHKFLHSIDCTTEEIQKISEAVKNVSFSKGSVPATVEGRIVQDADRLDAIGAVGIARTFAYGGANGQLIWHNSHTSGTSVQHFYDKLLKLKGLMNTSSAVEIAEERHKFMESYLNQFFEEWSG